MKIPERLIFQFDDFPEPGTTYIREDTLPNLTRAVLAVDLVKLERVLTETLQQPELYHVFDDTAELLTLITTIRLNQSQESMK